MVPLALAELHRSLPVGDRVEVLLPDGFGRPHHDGDGPPGVEPILTGAGFEMVSTSLDHAGRSSNLVRRERTLPDTVAHGMQVLTCGLNPSLFAADAAVGYARAGNRFWPAALAAGLVSVDRDPLHALRAHGVGMTDLVKRATVGADELDAGEYRYGITRLTRLCAWLRPAVVCFVGLAGWRVAVDRTARPGRQDARIGDSVVYLMPSTSGRNAATGLDDLARHFRSAAALA